MMAVEMFVFEVSKYSASFVVWMLRAWKSNASAVQEANPTTSKYNVSHYMRMKLFGSVGRFHDPQPFESGHGATMTVEAGARFMSYISIREVLTEEQPSSRRKLGK